MVYGQHGWSTKGGLLTGLTATLGMCLNQNIVYFLSLHTESGWKINSNLNTQIGRHGVWNAIYFGFFRTIFPVVVPDQSAISKTELNIKRFLLGCVCGTIGK